MSLCGYHKLQADRTRDRWLIGITYRSTQWADNAIKQHGNWVTVGFYSIAKYACLIFANLVNVLWLLGIQLAFGVCRLFVHGKKKPDRIKHVFVLMLENRSFDHLLGFSNLHGTDALTGQPTTIDGLDPTHHWNLDPHGNKIPVSSPAAWSMPHDPGHEFTDVKIQLCGLKGNYPQIDNSGFVADYATVDAEHPGEVMKCFAPEQLPVLTTLAGEFAVCDRWFSSMPGPTWPNRFFIHAASSGGLDHSPSNADIADSILFNGYTFDNGTIYDELDDEGFSWTVYKGDLFLQALAISGMTVRLAEGRFRDFADFNKDVQNPDYSTSYAFIEPDYRALSDFVCGNSQHPLDDITRGEALIKRTYEAIRNSPHWENSVLIVTYDEHGGFYDHVHPPRAVAPGDKPTNPENNRSSFDFKQLGVRVPAVIVSPLIPKNTIDHTVYDHTSVLATVESIFGLPPLTERDKQANSLNHLFSLDAPRADAPATLPDPAYSGISCGDEPVERLATKQLIENPAKAAAPPDPSMQGFLHVAFLRDLHTAPIAERPRRAANFLSIHTQGAAKHYMMEVHQKIRSQQPPAK
ncbi:MAG TPA: alkaline phosphatase family protein [Ktedonobacteraceae bacterium]|jgi:phospholipase C|nr:alkaline phosphatase family protein [Ktedonobacteraceae bacterium]